MYQEKWQRDRIAAIKAKGPVMSAVEKAKEEKDYKRLRTTWRKRKRRAWEALENITEHMDGKHDPKSLAADMGFEVDEDWGLEANCERASEDLVK